MSETALKQQLTKLAASYPTGSTERRKLLQVITGANFDPKQIGEVEPGALEEGTPEEDYQGDQFTQQEFAELGEKQENGDLGMKVDDTEAKLPTGQQEDQKVAGNKEAALPSPDKQLSMMKSNPPRMSQRDGSWVVEVYSPSTKKYILVAEWGSEDTAKKDLKSWQRGHKETLQLLSEEAKGGKTAGCEKLPEGPMRDNCEKKKDEGDKKAAMMAEDLRVRDGLIRLAHTHPEFRAKVLPIVTAYDNERKVMAAAEDAEDAKEAAKAVAKKAIELGYTKAEAIAFGKQAHADWGSLRS